MKLIILDRDGVINEDTNDYIRSPSDWIPIPDSLEAISLLCKHGYTIAVFTNQSGVGRGFFSERVLHDIHALMCTEVIKRGGHIDKIVYCPHLPTDECQCRKPNPGMLHQLMVEYNLSSLRDVIVVGDRITDLEAASRACKHVHRLYLVKTGKGIESLVKNDFRDTDVIIAENLMDVARRIVND